MTQVEEFIMLVFQPHLLIHIKIHSFFMVHSDDRMMLLCLWFFDHIQKSVEIDSTESKCL